METRQRIILDGNKCGRFKVPLVSLYPEGFLKSWPADRGLTHQGEDRHWSVSLIFWLLVVKKSIVGFYIPNTPRLALILEIRRVLKIQGNPFIVLFRYLILNHAEVYFTVFSQHCSLADSLRFPFIICNLYKIKIIINLAQRWIIPALDSDCLGFDPNFSI